MTRKSVTPPYETRLNVSIYCIQCHFKTMEYGLQTKLHAMLYIVAHHCDGLFVGLHANCSYDPIAHLSDEIPHAVTRKSFGKLAWTSTKNVSYIYQPSCSGGSRHFEKGRKGGIQCISPVVIYRKCTQRTICLLYGKRRHIEKNMRPIGAWAPQSPLNLPLCCTVLQTSCHPYSRSFRVAAAKIWNAVPSNVVPASSHKFPPVQRSSCCEHFIPWQP